MVETRVGAQFAIMGIGTNLDDMPKCKCGHVARTHFVSGYGEIRGCYYQKRNPSTCPCEQYTPRKKRVHITE